MVWHDCKTDPPKKDNFYLLVYQSEIILNGISYDCNVTYDKALYQNNKWSLWRSCSWTYLEDVEYEDIVPYKWAEVDLSEVE